MFSPPPPSHLLHYLLLDWLFVQVAWLFVQVAWGMFFFFLIPESRPLLRAIKTQFGGKEEPVT